MEHTISREKLLRIPRKIWKKVLFDNSIEVIVALDRLGVGGLEEIGISDRQIHAWLSSRHSGYHRHRYEGDAKSVILAAGWTPDRYERVIRQRMNDSIFVDLLNESYRRSYEASLN
jgi:hypothetical protein